MKYFVLILCLSMSLPLASSGKTKKPVSAPNRTIVMGCSVSNENCDLDIYVTLFNMSCGPDRDTMKCKVGEKGSAYDNKFICKLRTTECHSPNEATGLCGQNETTLNIEDYRPESSFFSRSLGQICRVAR